MSSIKCGRCGQRHESVTDVRACYNGTVPSGVTTSPAYVGSARATSKQAAYLTSLMTKEGVKLADGSAPDDIEKRRASTLIDNLVQRWKARKDGKTIPTLHPDFTADPDVKPAPASDQAERERKPFPKVPAGHYATTSATGNNDLDFWRVNVPEDGRWKGYQFVKRVIGGRPSQAVRGAQARAALEAIIKEGIDKCGVRYGQTIGKCRFCNRHLTDEESRQRGCGPDCAAARGIL